MSRRRTPIGPALPARAAFLAALLHEAYRGPAWHGAALADTVRALDADAAHHRPRAARHSAWEVSLHAAYWKHRIRQRILESRDRFPRSPSDWPAPPARPDAARWREDVALLEASHDALVALLPSLDEAALDRRLRTATVEGSLRGIACHDLYHAGQIRMLHRMYQAR